MNVFFLPLTVQLLLLKNDFDAHRERIDLAMLSTSTGTSGSLDGQEQEELLRKAQAVATSDMDRLNGQIDALTARLASMEQLNANLEASFKELSVG